METKIDDNYHPTVLDQLSDVFLKEHTFKLSLLYNMNKRLNLASNQEELFGQTEYFLKNYLHVDGFYFLLRDEHTKEFKLSKTIESNMAHNEMPLQQEKDISELSAQIGEVIFIQDVSKDDRFKEGIRNTGSFISLPLILSNNEPIGVLSIYKSDASAFKEGDKPFFSTIAQNIANTFERLRISEKTQREFMYDDLTNLFTKNYFLKTVRREYSNALRYKKSFSIIMADIDHFRHFNETFGQLQGDEILKKLTYILKASLRKGDIICRYGGEEFAIYLPETDKEDAVSTAEKLRASVERILTIINKEGNMEMITITVGSATYPIDGKTIEDVLVATENFVSEGKKSGRNRVIYTPSPASVPIKDAKSTQNNNTRSVLSGKEIQALLYKNVERSTARHKVSLKIAKDINYLQSIEIHIQDNWKACTILDISEAGFKGEIDSEVKIDSVLNCRAVMDTEVRIPDIFTIRVVYKSKLNQNKYRVGAEIAEGGDNWKRLLQLMVH